MPNTDLFYDPLSCDFITEVQQPVRDKTLEEKLSLVSEHIPRTRVSKVKFYLSLELKKRLQKLISKTDVDSSVIKIAEKILNTKSVVSDSINYLDLSNDDYTKISFLNKDRYEKIKDTIFKSYYITHRTKILVKYDRMVMGTYSDEFGTLSFGEHNKSETVSFCLNKHMVPHPIKMNSKKMLKGTEQKEDGGTEFIFDYYYEAPPDFAIPLLRSYEGSYINRHFCFRDGNVMHNSPNIQITDLKWNFYNLKEVIKPGVWNPEQRFHTSIHKVLNKLFPVEFTEREKNIFAEAYYKLVVIKDKNYEFSIVTGEDIREAYLEDNYLRPINGSTLWQSCMRYSNCQKYLEIYVDNPEIVSLAVLRKNNKVVARGIIWTDANGSKHVDRIYTYDNKAESLITASLDGIGYKYLRDFHGGQKYDLVIPFPYDKIVDYNYFPYIDSLRYYDTAECTLQNYQPDNSYWEFNETDGTHNGNDSDSFQCEICDATSSNPDFISEITHGRGEGCYGCDECTTYSDVLDRTIRSDYSSYCEYAESSVPDDSMIELSNGSYCWNGLDNLAEFENNYGYFVKDHSDFEYRELDGHYYHPDDTAYEELIAEKTIEPIEQIEQIEENETNQESIQSTNDVIL